MAENINVTAVPSQMSQTVESRVVSSGGQSVEAREADRQQEMQEAAAPPAALSVEELKAAIEQLNEFMKQGQRSLSFSVDKSVDEVVVRVVDTETQELIRQIPNEETLKFKQHLEGMLGMLFSDKA